MHEIAKYAYAGEAQIGSRCGNFKLKQSHDSLWHFVKYKILNPHQMVKVNLSMEVGFINNDLLNLLKNSYLHDLFSTAA